MKILKGIILNIFQSKPLFWLASKMRATFIIKVVRILANLPGGFLFVGMFDPNNIRKKINLTFPQNLQYLKLDKGLFLVDVNEHLGFRFYIYKEFDPLLLKISSFLDIDETNILLDIGANIGSTCIPFAIKYNAAVIAVEASKNNAFLLLKNAWLNQIKLDAHLVCAVDPNTANTRQWIKFFNNNGNSAANSIFPSWNPSLSSAGYEFVKTITIDKILENVNINKICLVKIDVEGSEEMVLKGFSKLKLLNSPIMFEYRIDVMKRDLKEDGSKIIEELSSDFEIYGITKSRDGTVGLINFDPDMPSDNAIAFPRTNKEYYLERFKSIMSL